MTKIYSVLFLVCSLFIQQTTSAQLVVAANGNGTTLAQTLAGNGVTISNIVINCPTGAAGTFQYTGANLGMSSGIMLTSGQVDSLVGPNYTGSMTVDNGTAGDADLDAILPSTSGLDHTQDACVLEFDMQVLSDSVEFKYIFGSEEYLEWVNSGYNDIFAFFISGPGIVGQQNIALVPGTATPVSIDNVNNVSYPQYYVDNGDGTVAPFNASNQYIQFDGYTTVLTAKKKGLQPCQTYHLKLAVADVNDGLYDSGVFLEANSLTSNYVSIDSVETDVPTITDAIEGCVNGVIRLHLQDPLNVTTTVHFQIGGTATNGVDYTHIADSITIPAGDTIVAIHINPITDALTEGTETVKIYLLLACNNQPYDSAVLNILDSISVTVAPNASICIGDQVQLQATGASTYTWTPATGLSATNIPNPIAAPTVTTVYKCTSTIGICVSFDSLTINVIPPPFTVNAGPDVASCTQPSANLNAVVTGTTYNGNPFAYAWTPATGLTSTNTLNTTASPSTPTTYVIQVTSGTCVVRDSVRVALGSLQITDTATNETCYGYHDGTVAVTSAIGSPPYAYIWNTGFPVASMSNLQGGTYTVTVTDNSGCTVSASLTVVGATQFTVNAGNDVIDCVNPSVPINAVVIGNPGVGNPFVYSWSPATGLTNTNTLTPTASPATPTDYTIVVTSGVCTATDTIHIAIGNLQITTSSTIETCFGYHDATATVNVTVGNTPYQYHWSNGPTTATITNLQGGTYDVTVVDGFGCTASATENVVGVPSSFFVDAGPDTVDCTNPSVTMYAQVFGNPTNGNAFVFTWSPATGLSNTNTLNPIASPAVPTDYEILVTSGVCTARDSIHVAIGRLQITSTSTDETCYGYLDGTATINIVVSDAPEQYIWNTGDSVSALTGLGDGVYTATVTDAFGCTATASMPVVGVLTPFSVNAGSDTIECLLPSVQLNGVVTGTPVHGNAFVYAWAPQAGLSDPTVLNPVASPASPTDYEILVSSGVCTARDTVHVAVSSISIGTTHTDETCFGLNNGTGNVNVTVGATPYSYFWSNSNPTASVTGLSAGTYYVTVLENFGCRAVDSIIVLAANQIVFGAPVITDVLCFEGSNGSIAVTATGGAGNLTYLWDDPTAQTTSTATGLVAGLYSLTVTDANACTAMQSYSVNEPPVLSTITTTTNATCYQAANGTANTDPSGGVPPYTYLWSTLSTNKNIFGLLAGVYSCIVTDQNGCSVTTAGVVNEPSDLLYSTSADAVKCLGDANGVIHVSASGGTSPYNYSATQDGSNFIFAQNGAIPGLAIGIYFVIISDNYGCTKVDTVEVPNATADVLVASADSTSCYGSEYVDGAVHILALSIQNGPYQYSIDGGQSQYSGDFYYLAAGDHAIHAVSFNGCQSDTTVTVLEPLPIIAEITPDTVVLPLGESKPIQVLYQNVTNPTFDWTPATGLSCMDCSNPTVSAYHEGDYMVTVSTVNGTAICYTTATVHVAVEPHKPLYIPNSFSPNGDGNNDLFLIYGEDIKLVDLKIFNRWGELVYKTNNQLTGWDGTYKGELQNPAVFTYTAKITFLDDKTANQNGTVTLIR